ncbi:unnamed protein product [Sphagnum balticum]
MIFDNYDNPRLANNANPAAVDIRQFLPNAYQGSVIITTRSSEVRIGHRIQITKLENLRDCLKILSSASNGEELEAAGAYLEQTTISLVEYLRLYKDSWARLQETSPDLSSYEDRTLYSTWQISFDHIKQRNMLSAKLLRLWGYFDNQDLWLELLQHSDSTDPDWIRELAKDEISFHKTAWVLSDHGLVEVAPLSEGWIESRGYSIHGCIHSWTIHVLNQQWDYNLAGIAVKFIRLHVPIEEAVQPWPTQRRLLQHAGRCSDMVSNNLLIEDEIA